MKKYVQVMVTACAVVLAACSSHRQGEPAEPQQTEQPQLTSPQKSDVTSRLQPRRVSPSPDKSIIALPQVTTSSSSSFGDFKPKVPGRRVAQVSVPGKYVALTFDDGPSGAYTPKILDILNRHGAKATFFVLGENAARHKSILAALSQRGMRLPLIRGVTSNLPPRATTRLHPRWSAPRPLSGRLPVANRV